MANQGATVWTATGRAKLQRVREAVARAVQQGIVAQSALMSVEASELAPDVDQEERLLSRGTSAGGNSGGMVVGDPSNGRFIRDTMITLREAIRTDRIVFQAGAGRMVARIGNASLINARTGFSWMTRQRGIQGPTFPFNRAYVQAVENGGAVWVVVPRGPWALEPSDGVYSMRMIKTMPPFGMFSRALANRTPIARRELSLEVKTAVREAAGTTSR